jgi:hypothetical protein
MPARITRGAAAREAAFLAPNSSQIESFDPQQLSSPPPTPPPTKVVKNASASKVGTKRAPKIKKGSGLSQEITPPTPKPEGKKRKRAAPQAEEDINTLPHNLGTVAVSTTKEDEVVQDVVQDEAPVPAGKKRPGRKSAVDQLAEPVREKAVAEEKLDMKEASAKRRSDRTFLKTDVKGTDPGVDADEEERVAENPSLGKKTFHRKTVAEQVKDEIEDAIDIATVVEQPEEDHPKKKAKKPKYGLTPGVTPFPDHPHPTPEECQQVNDLLAAVHGEIKPPEAIPAPSLTVTGCGEGMIPRYLCDNMND